MRKNIISSGLVALLVSLTSIGLFYHLEKSNEVIKIEHINSSPSRSAVYTLDKDGSAIPLNFNKTAEKVLDGVVHIKATHVNKGEIGTESYRGKENYFPDFFGDSFGPQYRFEAPNYSPRRNSPARVGTGSGVIVHSDGFIATNNHVIADADDIEVTLHDNRVYKARIVGSDPSTDLALLQIREEDLSTVPFTNSDQIDIGQWVLAVGNPMGLNSTVTAGIVSAKGRNINILRDKYAIEDFIQTDAAINPGNSGGALVDLQGGLVGINTAIASPNGAFAGYGFAVPANIVEKVVEDLLEYGIVQRGVLGVMIRSMDGNLAREKNLDVIRGVYVDSLLEHSAAKQAGVKVGDVIKKVNEIEVNTSPELQGMIARHRPGEEVVLEINRKGKEIKLAVVLSDRNGHAELTSKEDLEIIKVLGVELEDLDQEEANGLALAGGVKIKKLLAGKLSQYTQVQEGFIVTKVDGRKVESVEEFVDILDGKKGGIMLEGIYENMPGTYYYALGV